MQTHTKLHNTAPLFEFNLPLMDDEFDEEQDVVVDYMKEHTSNTEITDRSHAL